MDAITGLTPDLMQVEATQVAGRLLFPHYRNIDAGRATASVSLFSPDARVTARGKTTVGREELTVSLGEREARTHRVTQHVITNLEVLEAAPERITATGILTGYAQGAAERPERVARFSAEFTLLDGWLISALATEERGAVS